MIPSFPFGAILAYFQVQPAAKMSFGKSNHPMIHVILGGWCFTPLDNEHRCVGKKNDLPTKTSPFLGFKSREIFPGQYPMFLQGYFGVQHVSFREIFFPQPQPCSHAAISPPVLSPPSSSRGIWACPDWRNYNIGFSHINLRCPFCWSRIVKQLFYCCGGCFVCGKGVVWILFLFNFH